MKKFNRALMPFQEQPFNGDIFIEKEFLSLRDKFNINVIIETGCCLGGTTLWFAQNFDIIFSTEINNEYANYTIEKLRDSGLNNWRIYTQKSQICLGNILSTWKLNSIMFFLDAHWEKECPLEKELEIIAEAAIKPVIAIHDFKVPNESQLGYDSYNGQDFTFEWLKPKFDAIYGENNYGYYFNTFEKSEGAKRGIIYLYPKL